MKGLYVITDDALCAHDLNGSVEAAIRGGAKLVQYRSKLATPAERQQQAASLLALCRQHAIPLLINDDIELATAIAADGVHIGQSDTGLREARQQLGEKAIIGVTCHDSIELARQAQAGGASYVAFGRFFPSNTKPVAPPADIQVIKQARAQLDIPICAIGGITPANASLLLDAGADLLAVIHGVFGQADIVSAASAYAKLFDLE